MTYTQKMFRRLASRGCRRVGLLSAGAFHPTPRRLNSNNNAIEIVATEKLLAEITTPGFSHGYGFSRVVPPEAEPGRTVVCSVHNVIRLTEDTVGGTCTPDTPCNPNIRFRGTQVHCATHKCMISFSSAMQSGPTGWVCGPKSPCRHQHERRDALCTLHNIWRNTTLLTDGKCTHSACLERVCEVHGNRRLVSEVYEYQTGKHVCTKANGPCPSVMTNTVNTHKLFLAECCVHKERRSKQHMVWDPDTDQWSCVAPFVCDKGEKKRKAEMARPWETISEPGDWKCICDAVNAKEHAVCVCGLKRTPDRPTVPLPPGAWYCATCWFPNLSGVQHINWKDNINECRRCKASRVEWDEVHPHVSQQGYCWRHDTRRHVSDLMEVPAADPTLGLGPFTICKATKECGHVWSDSVCPRCYLPSEGDPFSRDSKGGTLYRPSTHVCAESYPTRS